MEERGSRQHQQSDPVSLELENVQIGSCKPTVYERTYKDQR
jgi:hypothetical protein